MRKDKIVAFKLRKQGKSYNEINKILGISKSTLSEWFKNNPESQKIKAALSARSNNNVTERIKRFVRENKLRWNKWREVAREEAKKEFVILVKKPLFIAGTMLYWGEGDSKPRNPVRLTNTDPRMIALYVKFLTNILNIPKEKIKASIILYSDLSEETCLNFWSNITKLSKSQFYKTQFIKGQHPTARLTNGICMVICNSRQLKEKMIVWIDLLSKIL